MLTKKLCTLVVPSVKKDEAAKFLYFNSYILDWCRRGDSNPHELPHTPLKRARLPVPPLRLEVKGFSKGRSYYSPYLLAAGDAAGAAGDACCVGAGVGVAV